jgi:hypothetical protein
MSLKNRNIPDRSWRTIHLPAPCWQGLAPSKGTLVADVGTGAISGTPALVSLAGTSSPFQEINSLGIGGHLVNATGQKFRHLLPIPQDMDLSVPLLFRVLWTTASQTTTDTVTWAGKYKWLSLNNDALAAADTAFDTPMPQQLVPTGGGFCACATKPGIITALQTYGGKGQVNGAVVLALEVNCSQFSLTGGVKPYFMGAELAYGPLFATDTPGGLSTSAPWA